MHVKRGFEVKVTKSEVVVAAALPMKYQRLPLSNLDLLLPPVDVCVFFCYGGRQSPGSAVSVLKRALALTLVSYYAFAGELVKNGAGEQELLCNNVGVDFSEARADVALEELDFHNPDESVDGRLVPARGRGILAVQVTQLTRGGLVVACTFSHQVADAHSANMFLVSWAEMARSEPLSRSPSFNRSFLLPRRPGRHHPSIDNMYLPISAIPPSPENTCQNDDAPSALSRIYYIKSDQINNLQSLANIGNLTNKRTKLEAISAFIWKTIASGGENFCRLGVVVDGRSRLTDCGDSEEESNLITSYFGNVLSIPFGEKRMKDLKQKPLDWVADEVHWFLQTALSKEHFLGLIDWVEKLRPEPGLSRIYATRVTAEEPAVVVSSGQRFPVRKVDFGWGPPVFGSYHFPWGGKSGYVMPMPGPKGNGDWIVYMHMLKEQLELIEAKAGHVFLPITSDYMFSFT